MGVSPRFEKGAFPSGHLGLIPLWWAFVGTFFCVPLGHIGAKGKFATQGEKSLGGKGECGRLEFLDRVP